MITFKEYISEKVFVWDIPKTSNRGQKVRFTRKEFERNVRPRLLFG
jgi:hypothetical protein